jgi:hypothetical protein
MSGTYLVHGDATAIVYRSECTYLVVVRILVAAFDLAKREDGAIVVAVFARIFEVVVD